MRLSAKIFMATVLPFLLIVFFYNYISTRSLASYLTNHYRLHVEKNLYHLQLDILSYLGKNENDLQLLIKGEHINRANPEQTSISFDSFLHHDDEYVSISAISMNAKEWLRISKHILDSDKDSRDDLFYSPIYQEPLLKMSPYLDYTRSDSYALPFFDLSLPNNNSSSGKPSGVIWLRTYPQELQDTFEKALPEMGKVLLVHSKSNDVILQADDTRQDFSIFEKETIEKIGAANESSGMIENSNITLLYQKFEYNDFGMTLVYYQPDRTIYFLANQLKKFNFLAVFAGSFIFILACFFMIRMITSPLGSITRRISKLGLKYSGAKNDADDQANKANVDEIKLLKNSFLLLEKRLSVYRDTINAEISTRKKTEKDLRDIHIQLEERVKDRTRSLEKTHAQLLHAEKLAAIGGLSSSIAHEFNNPLQGITNVILGIQKRAPLDEEDRVLVDMAISECDRMKDLINSLQDFNRPSSGRVAPVDIHATIDSLLLLSKKEYKIKGLTVVTNFAENMPKVNAVADQIKQVLLNLFNNAVYACEAGGTVTINTEVAGKDKVTIQIQDTGVGINPDHIDKIFDPFFSTKPDMKGTGLGLSISYGIIKKHRGRIDVNSTLAKGTTFIITLPIKGA